jgi:hypothetical protein
MSLKEYPHDHPALAEMQRMVATLTELVALQTKRIDRLEAELELRDTTVDVFMAQRAADQALALARGAAVLATR